MYGAVRGASSSENMGEASARGHASAARKSGARIAAAKRGRSGSLNAPALFSCALYSSEALSGSIRPACPSRYGRIRRAANIAGAFNDALMVPSVKSNI